MLKEEARSLLNEKAKIWLKHIIEDCSPIGVRNIFPEPCEDNNWLFNQDFEGWTGECIDFNNIKYWFMLKQFEDETWGIKLQEY